MNEINIPYHLLIPFLISFLFSLLLILAYWKWRYKIKRKSLWLSLIVFFITYAFFVGIAFYDDISIQIKLNTFDLNHDGLFTGNEITKEQKIVFGKLINDTGRNMIVFFAIILSGISSIFTFVISNGYFYYLKLKQAEK